MNSHAVSVLEFDTVRSEVASFCLSEEGKEFIAGAGFFSEVSSLFAERRLTRSLRSLLDSSVETPNLSMPAVAADLAWVAKDGAVLELEGLVRIMRFAGQASALRRWLAAGDEVTVEVSSTLPEVRRLYANLRAHISEDGDIRENDIPSLRSIRAAIRSLWRDIEQRARTHMSATAAAFQSDTPTMRDGRLVLPLSANYRGRLEGVAYEASGSGATLFFEPLDIFERNNQLVHEENRYRQEVLRILRQLSAEVRAEIEVFEALREAVIRVDAAFCRARYGRVHGCFPAEISDQHLRLEGARHPLLGKRAVPIDVVLHEGVRALLISGPNTGGKTVALKTVGLLALMNQFGLDIPAKEGSALPLFRDIYVDVGDEQSISASLSTFSAHLVNLSRIVENADDRCLVLLDELGSGTDPDQGAPLGMAVLDALTSRGATVLGTTHLGALKRYAMATGGVVNASVDFDEQELRPTYRIMPGLPGGSHAFEVAERVGLSAAVVGAARTYADELATDASRLLERLQEQERQLAARERELERRSSELAAAEEAARKLAHSAADKERELKKEGLRELTSFLSDSRGRLEALVREIREGGGGVGGDVKAARDFTGEIAAAAKAIQEELAEDKGRGEESKTLRAGMEVFVGVNRRGGVLKRRAKNRSWVVSVGAVTLTVPETDLAPAPTSSRPASLSIKLSLAESSEPAVFELDLRGLRAEEARRRLQVQVDRASIQGLYEFGVIHGRGDGILQKTVHEFLRDSEIVESFAFAPPQEGGFGKTNVRLKR